MDKWEFFQDAGGLWRWRCTSADGQRIFNSMRAHPTRALALADAQARGYTDGASEIDVEETFVDLKALRDDD
jgi:hypothetical protein